MPIACPTTSTAREQHDLRGNKLPPDGKRPERRGRKLPQHRRLRDCNADSRRKPAWHRPCCDPGEICMQTAHDTIIDIDTRTHNLSRSP